MKIQRNDHCPCGSRKKFKKCCISLKQKEIDASDEVPKFITRIIPEVEEECDVALQYLEEGNKTDAYAIANKLIQSYPDYYMVKYLQSFCCIFENNETDAILFLEEAVKLFPIFSLGYFNLGMLYKNSLKLSNSISCFKKVVQFESADSELYQKANEMLQFYENIINQKENMSLDTYMKANNLFNQAFESLQKNKYEEAIVLFKQSLSLSPRSVQAYGNMGLAYSGIGKHKMAVECFDQALALDPDYEPAQYNRKNISQLTEGEIPKSTCLEISYYSDRHKMQNK